MVIQDVIKRDDVADSTDLLEMIVLGGLKCCGFFLKRSEARNRRRREVFAHEEDSTDFMIRRDNALEVIEPRDQGHRDKEGGLVSAQITEDRISVVEGKKVVVTDVASCDRRFVPETQKSINMETDHLSPSLCQSPVVEA